MVEERPWGQIWLRSRQKQNLIGFGDCSGSCFVSPMRPEGRDEQLFAVHNRNGNSGGVMCQSLVNT